MHYWQERTADRVAQVLTANERDQVLSLANFTRKGIPFACMMPSLQRLGLAELYDMRFEGVYKATVLGFEVERFIRKRFGGYSRKGSR